MTQRSHFSVTRRGFLRTGVLAAAAGPVLAHGRFASAQTSTVDQYGGYPSLPVAGAPGGRFSLHKVNGRWLFATPDKNAYYLKSVQVVDCDIDTGNPGTYGPLCATKYAPRPQDAGDWKRHWAEIQNLRLRRWGFNGSGVYSYALQRTAVGRLPSSFLINGPQFFMRQMRVGVEPLKTLWNGVDATMWPIDWGQGAAFRMFPDVFDPNFVKYLDWWISGKHPDTGAALPKGETGFKRTAHQAVSPWTPFIVMDDGDFVFGVGPTLSHPHLGFAVACGDPWRTRILHGTTGQGYTVDFGYELRYHDPKCYTRWAMGDFFAQRYGTITALNAAWGSNYTTFYQSNPDPLASSWKTGTGLLDEDGRHPWIHPTAGSQPTYTLRGLSPTVIGDLDAWLGRIMREYYQKYAERIRYWWEGVLVTTQAPFRFDSGGARMPVFENCAPYVDVFEGTSAPPDELCRFYRITHKPIFLWATRTANGDCFLKGSTVEKGSNYATQARRGAAARDLLLGWARLRDSVTGDYPIIGSDWWEYLDKATEKANFGLVSSNRDNAYDGLEDRIAVGTVDYGTGRTYTTGGEPGDYGDALGPIVDAHNQIEGILTSQIGGATPGARRDQGSRLPDGRRSREGRAGR